MVVIRGDNMQIKMNRWIHKSANCYIYYLNSANTKTRIDSSFLPCCDVIVYLRSICIALCLCFPPLSHPAFHISFSGTYVQYIVFPNYSWF